MSSDEMPIFTRTYDLLAWLLPATNHTSHGRIVIRALLTPELCSHIKHDIIKTCATYSILVWSSQPSDLDVVRAI